MTSDTERVNIVSNVERVNTASDTDRTNNSKFRCLYENIPPHCSCPPACNEVTYELDSLKIHDHQTEWRLSFLHRGVINHIEKPDYPIQEYFGALGGVIGLGGKFMNIIQLLIFLGLGIIHFIKLRH